MAFFFPSQFNFVGKLLGPRGNTFKRLQANTGTKMSILGKGSMREKEKVSRWKFVASGFVVYLVNKPLLVAGTSEDNA